MARTTVEYKVKCKRCQCDIGYSGMMYEKIKEYGQSRPEYCEECRKILILEKMTMGAAYFSVQALPGEDLSIAIPGELGMVYHPQRPHVKVETPSTFDESMFGATPDKIVEIYQWLKDRHHQVVVVIGETGSGKSTALPYWLIFPPKGVPDDFFIREGQILITQPRIVATTSIAEYMGVLLGSSVGKGFDIGYRYSKDRNADRFNAAFLATDGSLINMIKNGQLNDLSVIMIDEAHERSLNIDIILRLLKDQLPLHPHLKLLIVSATINKDLFLNYFGADTASIVEFEAKRKFDYRVNFEVENPLPYETPRELRDLLVLSLVNKVSWLLTEQIEGRKTKGHILAFLHGVKPIEEAVGILKNIVEKDPKLKDAVEVFPLYSDLGRDETKYALEGKDKNKIRVVVCTNVAEASVTVIGTVYVVESGVENQAQWNIGRQEKRVELNLISQANAKQRWGRSGRTAPGEVYCLYTKEQFESMIPFPIPAIQRSSMDDIILLLKEMGVDDLAEGWIEGPIEAELNRSFQSLQTSGALDEDGILTEYGVLLRQFAYTATLTDLIILADFFGVAVEIATILPVIRNGGFKHLLQSDDNWDRQTRNNVKKIHEGLMKNCKDDVEFILKLYSLWQDPPHLKQNADKRMSLSDRRQAWAKEFFVNFDIFADDIEPEKGEILSLLSGHKKDRNFRSLDLNLINRVRIILAYCIPFTKRDQSDYVFSSSSKQGAEATYQLELAKDKVEVLDAHKTDDLTLLSLAKEFVSWEDLPPEDLEARLFSGTDSAEEWLQSLANEWADQAQQQYPIGSIIEASVKSVIKIGVFLSLADGYSGFVHVSKINPSKFVSDAQRTVTPGESVKVTVLGYDLERCQLQLSLAIPENSPLKRYFTGEVLEGTVANLTDFGAFVDLGLGYSGLIHISKLGRRVNKPSDVLKVGDKVRVEILDLKEERGSPRVSLRLVSVL